MDRSFRRQLSPGLVRLRLGLLRICPGLVSLITDSLGWLCPAQRGRKYFRSFLTRSAEEAPSASPKPTLA
jgi:hypothetical protein